jgi:hypothetical protein
MTTVVPSACQLADPGKLGQSDVRVSDITST